MNDVTFFAYSTGADPRIWATSGVGGSFINGGPSTSGPAVPLSGGGLNANFQINRWDTGQWGANVDGSGTLNRTDVGGTVDIQFNGGAAGTYTDIRHRSRCSKASGKPIVDLNKPLEAQSSIVV
ncbi:MAG: hypothetical protein JRI65_12485 [Deltaproteobacteria bacterium]|nr:hypothetical protein [Deltaproteobacteria bacterium]